MQVPIIQQRYSCSRKARFLLLLLLSTLATGDTCLNQLSECPEVQCQEATLRIQEEVIVSVCQEWLRVAYLDCSVL